jgi:DMSO/TMAO reductase YedYZ molybdopterin-dependent catalytic subunit
MTFRPRLATGPAAQPDLPPGQYLVTALPADDTEHVPVVPTQDWTFTVTTGNGEQRQWDWAAMTAMPVENCCVDLHSERGWSVMATSWQGVPMRDIFADVHSNAEFARVATYAEYTTVLPVEDLLELPTWIAIGLEGGPIPAEHGGPARLLVPHLYLYKSAKWVRDISLDDDVQPDTRQSDGLHHYGDPWREQRLREPRPATERRSR